MSEYRLFLFIELVRPIRIVTYHCYVGIHFSDTYLESK
ncbi:hypothetical protein PFLA_a2113 [Pseudoalteromonas flavipulchra NCIMB 2033 = ATCC BAA-314]|nr:hypothetical protein [Pseudoalteromonas flavipulchra NCIMB 2033 = ATCC BAA-314]